MKVLIYKTVDLAVERAARQLEEQARNKPDCVLGLATGGTMPAVYRRLVSAHEEGRVDFSKVRSFNLDEYVGLHPDHPCSYHVFMQTHLFGPANFDPDNTFLPRGDAVDPDDESRRYEKLIASTGPIDLQLLGIGANGHIGFNEPISSLGSRTRVKTLTKTTRQSNQRYFKDGEEPPKFAITVGIQTILESRQILLLATGTKKAAAVVAMIEGPLSAHCPASALQLHPSATIVLDGDAAADLKLAEYYFQVHPDGREEPLD